MRGQKVPILKLCDFMIKLWIVNRDMSVYRPDDKKGTTFYLNGGSDTLFTEDTKKCILPGRASSNSKYISEDPTYSWECIRIAISLSLYLLYIVKLLPHVSLLLYYFIRKVHAFHSFKKMPVANRRFDRVDWNFHHLSKFLLQKKSLTNFKFLKCDGSHCWLIVYHF